MKFALTTLISTIGYPVFVQLTGFLTSSQITADPLVAAVAGGCLMGAGLGLIIQSGASSGGLDIPPIILHRKLGWNLTVIMWALDVVFLAIQASFSPLTALLHGLILIACTYLAMNHILTIDPAPSRCSSSPKKWNRCGSCWKSSWTKDPRCFTAAPVTGERKPISSSPS